MKKRNYVRAPIRRFQNDFGQIHPRSHWDSLCCFGINLWRHQVDWDYDVIADVDNGCGGYIVSIGGEVYAWNVRLDSYTILSYFISYLIFHVITGIKNGCPCVVESVPALAHGSGRASDQGTNLRAFDLHNAQSTILNPFGNCFPTP